MSTSLFSTVFRVIPFLAASIHFAIPTPCDTDIPSRLVRDESEIAAVLLRCDEGQYLDSNLCRQCPEGTFMTKKMAEDRKHQHCLKCYEPGMYEIVLEPCTRTRDAKIMCEDQFYRSANPESVCQSECKRCDVCGVGKNMFKNFERRECRGHNNTVCCETEDTVVIGEVCDRVSTVRKTTSTTMPTPLPEELAEPESDIILADPEILVEPSTSGTTHIMNLQCTTVAYSLLSVLYYISLGIYR